MANFVFNVAKGKIRYYAELPGASDALLAVPIEAAGLQADATLIEYATLADLLAGGNVEQADMGRLTLSAVTVTPDATNDWVDITQSPDPVWTAAIGNALGAVVICYVPDTAASTDASIVPLSKHDFVATPNGADLTAKVTAPGFMRAG